MYAYFGLAIDRMMDILNPRLVQADGKLEEMETHLVKRFLRSLKWFAYGLVKRG
jgi:hypothetical protein